MPAGLIRKLGQVSLPARDIVRAIQFYRDTLGLPYIWNNSRMAFFQVGATRLLIELPEDPEFDRGSILYFDVEDIDATAATLKARGVLFEDEPHHIGDLGDIAVWMTFFRDSEGNLVGLQCERSIA